MFDSKILPQLAVWPSTIPGAGKGLFAMQTIQKGTYLGDYTGDVVPIPANAVSTLTARMSVFDISAGKCVFIFLRT